MKYVLPETPHYPLDLANELFQITEDMKVQGMCRAAL